VVRPFCLYIVQELGDETYDLTLDLLLLLRFLTFIMEPQPIANVPIQVIKEDFDQKCQESRASYISDDENVDIETTRDAIAVDEKHVYDLDRVVSHATQRTRKSAIDLLEEPPDGGWNAWLKVFGCFLMYANTLYVQVLIMLPASSISFLTQLRSFQVAFGAYQTYYQRHFLASSSPSKISWIGTIQSWFLITTGVLSGPLFDLGWFRPMLIAGNLLIILGLFTLSVSRSYTAVFLSQGACIGLGIGLLYVPSMALLGLSFKKKLSVAQGIVTSGNAVGKYIPEDLGITWN
jgi:hypothetical protein